jgi:formylglycine-generating enzyme required for sulfatase activity
MRQGIPVLLLALLPAVLGASTQANEAVRSVDGVQSALFGKQTELEDAARQVADKKGEVRAMQGEQTRLEQLAAHLDGQLNQAKSTLDKDYARLNEEPDFDLRPSQQAYQDAWAKVKQNQGARLETEQLLQDLYAELAMLEAQQKKHAAEIEALQEQKLRARVERLRNELKPPKQLSVSFTNVCDQSMTLAGCSEQTESLALQKAVNQFHDALINETSEAKQVKRHQSAGNLNIHVTGHKVTKSGFYDGVRFRTLMDVTLEARPAKNAACKLLNIDSKYCFDQGESAEQSPQQQEVPWVTLTIRSNQYQDKVSIDGVDYGNTPLDIMLPVGAHMVTIEKEGYRSFHQELVVKSDQTLRAVLREEQNLPRPGRVFADALSKHVKAPEMVVVGGGRFLIGENASQQVTIDKAYALSATPVTIDEFKRFVDATDYQTDAELKKLCTTVDNSQIIPISNSYWRNPGFKQSANSPAVCISRNDATAYTKWLSRHTGYRYRLPTETEWEVAARAGNKTAYWWGDKFGSGRANTGWGGTKWSNVSTSPVRSFKPNSYGLYDMVGNVWEWTSDSRGVTKGGSWSFSPNQATAYSKLFLAPNTAANYVGFRILREL